MSEVQEMENGQRYVSRSEFATFERNVDRSFGDIGRTLEGLSRKIDTINVRGTDWKAIISGLGVFAAVCGLVGGLFAWGLNKRLDSLDGMLYREMARVDAHVNLLGHPAINERVKGLEAARKDLDDKLQKEDDTVKAMVAGEIGILQKTIEGGIEAANKESTGRHDVQTERIYALEREVFPNGVPSRRSE